MEPKQFLDFIIKETSPDPEYKYSICTLVTNMEEYGQMVESFLKAGFTKQECEFRYIDNTVENSFDAYQGLNLFLQNAKGENIILCHQDILIQFDDINVLEKRIVEIANLDENWAILGNAGGIENDLYRRCAINLIYEDGFHQKQGTLPQKVVSVDENFIVVRRSANLALSHDLEGFHMYGSDLCLVAELLGYTAYVIDFKLLHKSYGNASVNYHQSVESLVDKYIRFMRNRRIVTTIADFYLSSSKLRKTFAESKLGKKIARKIKKIKVLRANR